MLPTSYLATGINIGWAAALPLLFFFCLSLSLPAFVVAYSRVWLMKRSYVAGLSDLDDAAAAADAAALLFAACN